MAIKNGDKIKVEYEGKLEDGTVFDSSTHGDHSHPLEFEVGAGKVIKGFDEAVVGMRVNEEKEFTIKSADAYGEPNDKAIQKLPRDKLPKDQEPKEGMMLTMQTADGKQANAKIVKVEEKEITIDMNHPLAGKDLTFKIKVLEVN
ncbi:MAG: peptidylprolyl isomerase [Nanoarchaeota archaeon]|nr:peptidylprolyl isomerase [Nanoarchaeota archaeon]